jgi:peptidyl-prolyl cis-trans isomerase C
MSIIVNDVEISDEEIGQELQHHPAPSQEQAWYLAAQSLVIRQLLLQQAAENGLYQEADSPTAGDQEEQVIDQLLESDVTVPEADEATCQRFYDSHPDSFMDEVSGKRKSLIEAQPQIRDYLHTKAMRIAVSEYIKALSYKADIKGFTL